MIKILVPALDLKLAGHVRYPAFILNTEHACLNIKLPILISKEIVVFSNSELVESVGEKYGSKEG